MLHEWGRGLIVPRPSRKPKIAVNKSGHNQLPSPTIRVNKKIFRFLKKKLGK